MLKKFRFSWPIFYIVCFCILVFVPSLLYQFGAPASDYDEHLKHVEEVRSGIFKVVHPLFHLVSALLATLFGTQWGVIFVILMTQITTGYLVYRILDGAGQRLPQPSNLKLLLMTFALLIVAPLNLWSFPKLYFSYYVTSMYHNPTYQMLKPLALLLFIMSSKMLNFEQRNQTKYLKYLFMTVLVGALATFAKPSFTIILLPALLMAIFFYRNHLDFRFTAFYYFIFAFLLTAIVFGQWFLLYNLSVQGEGVVFEPFTLVLKREPSIMLLVLKFLASCLFPVAVAALFFREFIKSRALILAWCCYGVGMAYFLLLAESGSRNSHGNFGWGASVSLFIVFVYSASFLLQQNPSKRRKVAFAVLAAHALCGIVWYAASHGLLFHLCVDVYGNWCWN